jgi:hypothetical protein
LLWHQLENKHKRKALSDISKAELNWSFTYIFNFMASDSKGDKVPDVNIMESTPNLRNFSIASPGDRVKVLDLSMRRIATICGGGRR